MDRLAESRAEACRQALILRGVPASRVFVTYRGRGGRIRTDFVPHSVHDSADLAKAVTTALAPQSAPGQITFASPSQPRLAALSQAWAIDHTDSSIRMHNRAALEVVSTTMLRFPALLLEVSVGVPAHEGASARLLSHFPNAADAQLDDETARAFRKHDTSASGGVPTLSLHAALASIDLDPKAPSAASSTQQQRVHATSLVDSFAADHPSSFALTAFTRLAHSLQKALGGGGSGAGAHSHSATKRHSHAALEQLARARVESVLAALTQLGLPEERLFGGFVVGASADQVSSNRAFDGLLRRPSHTFSSPSSMAFSRLLTPSHAFFDGLLRRPSHTFSSPLPP